MEKRYAFKEGFESENGNLAVELSILAENMESRDVFRLITALDAEYREVEKSSGNDRKGFKEWHLNYE